MTASMFIKLNLIKIKYPTRTTETITNTSQLTQILHKGLCHHAKFTRQKYFPTGSLRRLPVNFLNNLICDKHSAKHINHIYISESRQQTFPAFLRRHEPLSLHVKRNPCIMHYVSMTLLDIKYV